MNEYLGGADGGKRFGAPQFTDVFHDDPQRYEKYRDTKLSPYGAKQVQELARRKTPSFVPDCDLVVVSPLTRALQTYDLGIKPHFDTLADAPSVIAVPLAAERVYLISDVGRPTSELQNEFSYVDFSTAFDGSALTAKSTINADKWWYQPSPSNYAEWRPIDNGQKYACPAEPLDDFSDRMSQFYDWLQKREENSIAVVCHHGVIEWFLDMSFVNCEYRTVPFHKIRPKYLNKVIIR